ncbi:MAG: hypothetical protein QM762_26550 [Chryseolinea sp.]
MTLLLTIINLLLIGSMAFLLWRRQTAPAKVVFWPALLMKLGAGICLGVIYLYYYQGEGDTLVYFSDASTIADLARRDLSSYLTFLWNSSVQLPLYSDVAVQPRTLFMLKLASVFTLLSHNNYWITAIYFSFVSFVSAWYLTTQIERTIPSAYWPSVAGFLFFPSAVFWSSGLIKESLAMAGIFFLAGCFLRAWFSCRLRVWEWILIPISAWVVWSLKYYFLGVFLPVATASLVVHKLYQRGLSLRALPVKILVWMIIMIGPLTALSWLHPNFNPPVLMAVIVDSYRVFHEVSNPEDLIYYHNLQPDPFSLLIHSPRAVFAGIFRPLPWEANTDLQTLASLENILLLVLAIGASLNLRAWWRSNYRLLITSVIVFAVALAAFLALSSPNFGTLSRYKVGFLSFLVTILLIRNPFVINMLRILQRYMGPLAR